MINYLDNMSNSQYNPELYQEMLQDEGCQYQVDVQSDMFENMMCDYL